MIEINININNINVEDLVKYLNEDLKKDKTLSVNKWCDLKGIKRSTFKSKMRKHQYKFDVKNRVYIKSSITSSITSNITINNKDIEPRNKELNLIDSVDIDKLKLLINNIDSLLKLVEKNSITSNITIDNTETSVKSLRINNEIYEKVKKKAADNNISISSIVNKALLDYLNNYL